MTADFQQVPSQAFFIGAPLDLDPWLAATSNMNINWNKGSKRGLHTPPLFDDEGTWSSPSSPIFASIKKPVLTSEYLSTSAQQDLWAGLQDSEDDSGDNDSFEDSDDGGLNLYKTELCRSFAETGTCRYGLKCQFAHGANELRHISRHPKYKTEICKTFHTQGTCPYGTRCRFIHTKPNSRNVTPRVSPGASPIGSPSSSPHLTASRSPSPPTFVPNKWASSWPQRQQKSKPPTVEEGHGENENTVPEMKASTPPLPSTSPKKRLQIFRSISNNNLLLG